MKFIALFLCALITTTASRSQSLTLVAGGGNEITGSATNCKLHTPFGIDFDQAGNAYIVEMAGGERVLKVDQAGQLSVLAGTGEKGDSGDGGPAARARFNGMHSLAVGPGSDIFIADTWNNRVRRVDSKSGNIFAFAGSGKRGFSGDGGPAKDAEFGNVYCVAFDSAQENLFIADLDNRRVRAINLKSGTVMTVAGNGKSGIPVDGAKATDSPLVDPRAVAIDSRGALYILERSGHALRKVESDGTIRTVAGTGKKGNADGDALHAEFNGPKHLCVDANDDVIIADTDNHAIRKFLAKEHKVISIAGSNNGPSKLNQPHGVQLDKNGILYLADSLNNRVLKVASQFPAFTMHHIDNFGNSIGQTALVDVDRDGDLDWIAGNASYSGGEICWWEFQGPDQWIRHPLGKGNTDVGGAAFDVNGDGWVDFVSGSILLLNSREPKTKPFLAFDIGTIHSHDTEFADVNGDGRMDLIANSDKAGLFWYEIPANPTNKWIAHLIGSLEEHKVHGGVSPRAVADFDGDGDNDVTTAQGWYENLGGGLKWRFRRVDDFLGEAHQFGIAVRSWVCDMDGDKDIDIVQAENDNPDGRIAWFENDGKGNFTRHMVRDKGRGEDFHSLAVADFDGDGDLDIYSGAGPISASKKFACYIWENAGGGKRWIEHKIADKHCHEAEAADVDGDGDIDICSKPWSGTNEHFFLRNMLVESKRAGR